MARRKVKSSKGSLKRAQKLRDKQAKKTARLKKIAGGKVVRAATKAAAFVAEGASAHSNFTKSGLSRGIQGLWKQK